MQRGGGANSDGLGIGDGLLTQEDAVGLGRTEFEDLACQRAGDEATGQERLEERTGGWLLALRHWCASHNGLTIPSGDIAGCATASGLEAHDTGTFSDGCVTG